MSKEKDKSLSIYRNISDPLTFIQKIGHAIAMSGMCGAKNPEAGQVVAMTCLMERKSPTEIARRYHVIEGKLSMKAGALLADFKTNGHKYKVIERSPERAAIEMTNEFQTQLFELTWEDAQKEPFVYGKNKQIKDNYATPRIRMQMLWARVVSDAVEVMAPEISYGVYTPEEISDFSELPNASSVCITDDGGVAAYDEPERNEVIDAVFERVDASPVQATPVVEKPTILDEHPPREVLEQIRNDVQLLESFEPGFGQKFAASISAKTGGRKLSELTTIECVEISNALKKKLAGFPQS